VRQSAAVINAFTIAKLMPLAVFVLVGCWFVDVSRFAWLDVISPQQVFTGSLLLVFAFAGYDSIGAPAGEASDPKRHVPFAMVATIVGATVIMTAVQIVAGGTLANLAATNTPLADASMLFLGAAGGLLMTSGSVISMTGTNAGQLLTGSRVLFAMAENGDLPLSLQNVHARYRTPANAILVTSVVACVLGLSGSFVVLAVASALGRLVIIVAMCIATLRLRTDRFRDVVAPASFTAPLGPVVPGIAMVVSLLMIAGATEEQLIGGAAALAIGGVLFATRPHLAG
jgi:amino acid transporter